MTSLASFRAREASISPSAAITLARASLVASASVAMARCSCTGSRTSFLNQEHPLRYDFLRSTSVCVCVCVCVCLSVYTLLVMYKVSLYKGWKSFIFWNRECRTQACWISSILFLLTWHVVSFNPSGIPNQMGPIFRRGPIRERVINSEFFAFLENENI